MSRISTAQLFANTLATLQRKQSQLAEIQRNLASGKRINSAADDPVGAGRVLEVSALSERITQYRRNIDVAEGRLALEEATLAASGDNLNQVRELALAALNGTADAQTREIIGRQIETLLGEALALANTQDANEEFIFAGTRVATEPFGVSPTGAFAYSGNNDRRQVDIADNLPIAMTDPGGPIFFDLAVGNGRFEVRDNPANAGSGVVGDSAVTDPTAWVPGPYTITFIDPDNYEVRDGGGALVATGVYQEPAKIAFLGVEIELSGAPAAGDSFDLAVGGRQDLFTTYQDLADALTGAVTLSATARHNLINRSIANVDQALAVNQNTRASIGSRLQQLDSYRDLNERQFVHAQEIRSRIEDLDYAQAISDFEFQSATLEAAQKTFLAIQNLSLFRLLR